LGKRDLAKQALQEMEKFPLLARDPVAYFRRHGNIDAIVDALTSGLQKARKVAAGS
jgi:hypothetical protein